MIVTTTFDEPPPETVTFLDHRSVAWKEVQRTRFWVHQHFRYDYPGTVRDLRQRLVVVPSDSYGHQRVCHYQLDVSAQVAEARVESDMFGNRVFQCYIPHVAGVVDFEVWAEIERHAAAPPRISVQDAARYHPLTPLTATDERLMRAAHALGAAGGTPLELAERINSWTYSALRYRNGATTTGTTASEALHLGEGVCQDYAHIMLALCRTVGLAARYVSGHLLGEGGSHAWVEVLLPTDEPNMLAAHAYDPTNHCRARMSYITIAVGRDYRDVAPTSGKYTAPYQGKLTASKKAGLTLVEYVN